MNVLLRKLLVGTSLPQEYISLEYEQIEQPLQVYLSVKGNNHLINVSDHHLFLGYKPLIMSILSDRDSAISDVLAGEDIICLSLSIEKHSSADASFEGFPCSKKAVAFLILRKIQYKNLDNTSTYFFTGVRGKHRFLSAFHVFNYNLRKKFSSERKGNIGLQGNLQQQVETAYAVPRVISVITLSDGHRMNMFPTDLHGRVNENYYISSLRIGGKASEQIDRMRKVTISDVDSSFHQTAYALGKNHMRDPDLPEQFEIMAAESTLHRPIPVSALSFHNLIVDHAFDFGIHRIYVYKILSSGVIREGQRLTHMHRTAIQWRINHNLHTNLLFR